VKAALINTIATPYELADVEVGSPTGREVLVEVKGSGLCHSDLHLADNDYGMPLPLMLGHEIAGVVTEVGPDATMVKVGDHVVACVVPSCGRCVPCSLGNPTACENAGSFGRDEGAPARYTRDGEPVTQAFGIGGFSEYVLTHEAQVVSISKDVPFDRAALLGCGVVTGAGSVINSAKLRFGQTAVIIGCGGVGLNAVQGAALAGARKVIAVDLQQGKLELAKKFGATDVVNPADGDPIEQVRALTGGKGVDHAFEVIGLKPTLEQAVGMLGHFGTAYVVGMQKPGGRIEMNTDPMDPASILQGEQAIRGVFMGTTNFRYDVPLFAEMYLQGRLNLDDLVSKTVDIGFLNKGYEELKGGGVARNVITTFNADSIDLV